MCFDVLGNGGDKGPVKEHQGEIIGFVIGEVQFSCRICYVLFRLFVGVSLLGTCEFSNFN